MTSSKAGLAVGLLFLGAAAVILFFVFPVVGFEFSLAMILTSLILLGIYAILVTEVLHRMTLALFGAALTIVVGITVGLFPPEKTVDFVVEAIDFNTIGLLLGMMIIVGVIAETGVFQYAGIKVAKKAKGDVWKIMLLFSVLTAFASAFLDNVTAVLLMVPVTISIANALSLNPIPLIIAQVLASNVGGTATLIGDPPNIMIAWMVVTAAISLVLTYYFGLIIGLAIAFGIFILLNMVIRRRALGSGFGGTFSWGVTYRCIACGHRFKGGTCPRCGSKMRRAEF